MFKNGFLLGIIIISMSKIHAQDTIILRNTLIIIANVHEVGEDYIVYSKIDPSNSKTLLNIKRDDVRKIKYKNGYIDKLKITDTANADKDVIQFISSKTIKGTILEINDEDVLVDLYNRDTVINIPIKMIANIKYANGYVEKRNEIIINKTPIVAEIKPQKTEEGTESKKIIQTKIASLKLNENTEKKVLESTQLVQNSLPSTNQLSDNKPSKSRKYLGISFVIDSSTNLSRSFALFQLINKNIILNNGDSIIPVLTDYPFGIDYSISGVFKKNVAEFKIFKEGKKTTITTTKNWKDIYNKISSVLSPNSNPKKSIDIDEGSRQHIAESNIKDCLPGFEYIKVSSSVILPKLQTLKLHFESIKDPIRDVTEVYGKYSNYDEKDLFFFKNSDVPEKLKEAIRPLIFPIYKSVAPCLKYLSNGIQINAQKKYSAALNCFFAALYASNTIIASPYDRASIRGLIFEEISNTYAALSPELINTISLFKLGADLNKAYLNSLVALDKKNEYKKSIIQMEEMCTSAENAAKKIRGQKRLGGILALASFAGSVASISPLDNALSESLMNQSVSILSESFDQSSKASMALYEQFKNLDIDSKTFIAENGESIDIGKSFLADEISYFIINDPNSCFEILQNYSKDKIILSEQIKSVYAAKNENTMKDLYIHISEIEAKILNYELRKMKLPDHVKNSF